MYIAIGILFFITWIFIFAKIGSFFFGILNDINERLELLKDKITDQD